MINISNLTSMIIDKISNEMSEETFDEIKKKIVEPIKNQLYIHFSPIIQFSYIILLFLLIMFILIIIILYLLVKKNIN